MREIKLEEEIREFSHPDDPTIVVGYAVPDRMEGLKRAQETGKLRVEPILGPDQQPIVVEGKVATREVFDRAPIEKIVNQLGEVIRYVNGISLKKDGQIYAPKDNAEWARIIMRKEFDYDSEDPVEVSLEEDVARDPDTRKKLKKDEYQLWQDPETYAVNLVLWDQEKNEPLRRKRRHTFWEALLDRSIHRPRRIEEGKETPTSQNES